MFELRRQRTVARHRRPAVVEQFHLRPAKVDHRLDGEDHARLEQRALAGLASMDDVRRVVEHPADAVAAEIAHHRAALRLGERLDRVADVAEGVARPRRGDAATETRPGDVDQPPRLQRHVADQVHPAGVAVPAVDDDGHVDVDDVAVLQALGTGNAVADDVIDADARGMGVAAVEDRRRHRAGRPDERLDPVVEVGGQRLRHDVRHEHVEDARGKLSGSAHPGEGGGVVELDRRRRFVEVGVGHPRQNRAARA